MVRPSRANGPIMEQYFEYFYPTTGGWYEADHPAFNAIPANWPWYATAVRIQTRPARPGSALPTLPLVPGAAAPAPPVAAPPPPADTRVTWDFDMRYVLFTLMQDANLTHDQITTIWNTQFPPGYLQRTNPVPWSTLQTQYGGRVQRAGRAVAQDWVAITAPQDTWLQDQIDAQELLDDQTADVRSHLGF